MEWQASTGAGQNSSRLALILTFSPWEKEQTSPASAWAQARPANPSAGLARGRRIFHPLLEVGRGEGEAKAKSVEKLDLTLTFSSTPRSCLKERAGQGCCGCETYLRNFVILPA